MFNILHFIDNRTLLVLFKPPLFSLSFMPLPQVWWFLKWFFLKIWLNIILIQIKICCRALVYIKLYSGEVREATSFYLVFSSTVLSNPPSQIYIRTERLFVEFMETLCFKLFLRFLLVNTNIMGWQPSPFY